jgi:hypothetical protein
LDQTDILVSLTIETWPSRLNMVETLKNGTSIKRPRPSEPNRTINHSISTAQEMARICKSGAPTHTGGRSSTTLRRKRSS